MQRTTICALLPTSACLPLHPCQSLILVGAKLSALDPQPYSCPCLPPHSPQGMKALLADGDRERAADLSELLYETALLTSGFQVCLLACLCMLLTVLSSGHCLALVQHLFRTSAAMHEEDWQYVGNGMAYCQRDLSCWPSNAFHAAICSHKCLVAVACSQACVQTSPPHTHTHLHTRPMHPQVDSPKDYASKVFTLMKIALGYDISDESAPVAAESTPLAAAVAAAESAPSSSSSSSSSAAQAVEAEVVDPNDPWKKS